MRLLLIVLAATVAEAGESDAAKLFSTQCAACHTVPDPVVRTDRAWIDQVAYTT